MEIARREHSGVPWESVLAQIITWHHEFPTGGDTCTEADALDVVLAAITSQRLDLLEVGVGTGAYRVRRTGENFRLLHCWDPSVEVADMFLERRAAPSGLPDLSDVEQQWITTRPVGSRGSPPKEVLQAATERATAAIQAYRLAIPEGQVPDSFPLGDGMTAGDMISVLAVVMGIASLAEETARRLSRLETTLVHMSMSRLAEILAEMCPAISEEHRALAVERLTYQIGRSCRTSPLVPHGDTVIICPPLVTPRAVDPIMLRSAAHDSKAFGAIGLRQGGRASAWADWLRTTPGVLVAERVPVVRGDGRSAGDLDVVVVDPEQHVGLCLEIKWPIEALTLTEVNKVETWVTSASHQLDRVRGELRSGEAEARFPRDWPAFESLDWTWCVGTPQQLCLRPVPVPNMFSTSLRYVHALGSPPGLNALVGVLRNPDLPVRGVHFRVGRKSLSLGRHLVHMEVIGIDASTQWRPRFV